MIPDYCEPIIGWRIWNVAHANAAADPTHLSSAMGVTWPHYTKLTAVHLSTVVRWIPGKHWSNDGICESPCESPCLTDFNPGCGIYCFKTDEMLLGQTRILGPSPVVVGRVALWGRVAEHRLGYRGQFAYPVSLHYAFNLADAEAVALAASYGIPYQEHPQWTSAQSRDGSWPNRYASPFPRVLLPPRIVIPQIPQTWAPIHPTPRPPERPKRPKSKNPLECEQPSFNRGKPTHWIIRHGAWVRSDNDD